MADVPPVELPGSHLRFRVPNCVRVRRDGSDEVAGVQPDLPVLPTEGESDRNRAWRVLETIATDLHGRAAKRECASSQQDGLMTDVGQGSEVPLRKGATLLPRTADGVDCPTSSRR
jgi:hypothetical protein